MEKKIIKTNEEEMKYVSPKSKVFTVEIKSALLQAVSPGVDTDPDMQEPED